MLSKSQISFINALHQKKYRKERSLFIAEGIKSITEFLHSDYVIDTIFCTPGAAAKLGKLSQKVKLLETGIDELKKISALTTPQEALALIRIPEETNISAESFKDKFSLVLDGIQDPGNLGTIIRTADWFGFEELICSEDTVEAYNPKVVQATMGSLSRIRIHYTNLAKLFSNNSTPVFGAFLDGIPLEKTSFPKEGFLVLGNEGNGISPAISSLVTEKITIPRFGAAESLNVAVSAAIFCWEVRKMH